MFIMFASKPLVIICADKTSQKNTEFDAKISFKLRHKPEGHAEHSDVNSCDQFNLTMTLNHMHNHDIAVHKPSTIIQCLRVLEMHFINYLRKIIQGVKLIQSIVKTYSLNWGLKNTQSIVLIVHYYKYNKEMGSELAGTQWSLHLCPA